MNVREAVLRAADHIERNPGDFFFGSREVPHSCGTPGCALGWVGYFLGAEAGSDVTRVGCDLVPDGLQVNRRNLGNHECEFYCRMDALMGESWWADTGGGWTEDASLCAEGLRRYADKYHPAPAPQAKYDFEALCQRLAAEPRREAITRLAA